MYAKIEQQGLNYIKTNRQKIRVDLYSGLADAVAKGDTNATDLGRTVSPPSSYTNSPRQMFQLYQDAMTVVRNTVSPTCLLLLHVIRFGMTLPLTYYQTKKLPNGQISCKDIQT